MILREYQIAQNNAVRQSAKRGNKRIISCIATGSGKSIMIAELAKSAMDKMNRVAIVLPRRSLVNQLSESFHGWGINHGVVMAGVKRFTQPLCQIISIDTYMSRISSGSMKHIDADLLIIDELHLQFTPKKLELFSKYKTVVGFSATPIAPKKQSLGVFYHDIVETISMTELMDLGFLSKLKYFSDPRIDVSGIKIDADGDFRESQLGDAMDKPKLIGDIYENWKRIGAGKPTVVFASSQSHARHLCDEFNGYGWTFEYVDCTTPDDERKDIFSRVASGKTTGICNVGIVSVGIDIPNLEVVVLARPTRLISVYLQCVGRVTRLFKGKEHGIVIDHAGIIERLGFPTDNFEWSLDGVETVEERAQKKKEERKEPKKITCSKCHYVYTSSRNCPSCGFEAIPKGEAIPFHQADLKELTAVKKTPPAEKANWYAQFLFIARRKGYQDNWAAHQFNKKFGEWPHKKQGVEPVPPTQEVLGFMQHLAIKHAKSHAA